MVKVNVDPEFDGDHDDEIDQEALIAAISRILSVSESRWRAVVDEVATEIDDAVNDEPVVEQIDLRDHLEATSVVVFADAVLLAFLAPKQFPMRGFSCSWIEDLEVDGIEVREDLLDHA
ncbi:hypothetical protein ACU8V6_00300 [Vibrio alginolyticus]